MKKITANRIKNYVDYFNELIFLSENGKNFSVGELQKVYEVDSKSNPIAKKLGFINFDGVGPNIKYQFIIKRFEPIHARKVIEAIRKENRENMKSCTRKRDKKPEIKIPVNDSNESSIDKYTNFFNTLKVLIENNAAFSIGDMIKRHGVSKNTMTFAYSTGLMKKDGHNNYQFNKKINEFNVSSIIKTISH